MRTVGVRVFAWVVVLLVALSGSIGAASVSDISVKIQKFADAAYGKDLDGLRSLFTDQVIFFTPGDFSANVGALFEALGAYLQNKPDVDIPPYVLERFGEDLKPMEPGDARLWRIARLWAFREWSYWLTSEGDWAQVMEWFEGSAQLLDRGLSVPRDLVDSMFDNFYMSIGYTHQLKGTPSAPYQDGDERWYVDLFLDEYKDGASNALIELRLGFSMAGDSWLIDHFELVGLSGPGIDG